MLYRQTNDEDLLAQVGATINETFVVDFSPALLLIVTWDRVPTLAAPRDVRMYYSGQDRTKYVGFLQSICMSLHVLCIVGGKLWNSERHCELSTLRKECKRYMREKVEKSEAGQPLVVSDFSILTRSQQLGPTATNCATSFILY